MLQPTCIIIIMSPMPMSMVVVVIFIFISISVEVLILKALYARFLRHYVTSLKTRTKEQLLQPSTLLIHGGNAKNRAFLHSHIVCVISGGTRISERGDNSRGGSKLSFGKMFAEN